MVFSSQLFLFWFLPAALAFYYLAPRRLKHLTLTLFSYVFYGWANPSFSVLLLISTLIDWIAGLVMAGTTPWSRAPLEALPKGVRRNRRERFALLLSVSSNLSLLGFFKYFNFAVDSWNGIATAIGVDVASLDIALRVTLPLGISFYTF